MNLRPGLLPSLGVFAAAARHQNFAHAAEELHLTASAVSHHVRKLETSLGVALFRRHARGVTLTGEGRLLADAASAAVSDLEAVAQSLGRSDDRQRLRINTLHSLAHCWLLPRLPRFLSAHPELRISLDTGMSLARFEDGGPDLAIRHGAGHWPGLKARHLMDDALFPVAAPSLPGVEDIADPSDLLAFPLLSDLALQGWPDWFRAAGLRGQRLPDMHMFNDSTDVMRAAAVGIGIGLARRHIVAPYLQRGELQRLPGPELKTRFAYYIVHPAHRRPRAPAAAFIEWLRGEARDVAPAPETA
ncbi:LysR substrate-binding domain-containing protein [Luteimonas sp. 22616]|uniref:LysR substrate-binding domain-containing protein n=1 Tax=Luteimonas sp. 22616 TaxID=3453951 RepID=UPI003F873775